VASSDHDPSCRVVQESSQYGHIATLLEILFEFRDVRAFSILSKGVSVRAFVFHFILLKAPIVPLKNKKGQNASRLPMTVRIAAANAAA